MPEHRLVFGVAVLVLASSSLLAQSRSVDPRNGAGYTPGTGLTLEIAATAQPGKLRAKMTNSSSAPIRLWQGWNTWGAMNWRVLLIRNGKIEIFFQNPNQMFTRNGPAFDEIGRGRSITRYLDLNGGNWCGLGVCSAYNDKGFAGKSVSLQRGDVLVVIYDVRPTTESFRLNVWYGVTAAIMVVK